jgi:hypothetical protein
MTHRILGTYSVMNSRLTPYITPEVARMLWWCSHLFIWSQTNNVSSNVLHDHKAREKTNVVTPEVLRTIMLPWLVVRGYTCEESKFFGGISRRANSRMRSGTFRWIWNIGKKVLRIVFLTKLSSCHTTGFSTGFLFRFGGQSWSGRGRELLGNGSATDLSPKA